MKLEEQFSISKKELRKEIKAKRNAVKNKEVLDSKITKFVLNLEQFKISNTILCYCSLPGEVSTDEIINASFDLGKKVAVPYCRDNQGHMDFYYIHGFDDLKVQSFGVREPIIDKCKKVEDFASSIIIVPGMCFDKSKNRLGYGKGFYDRFLQNLSLISIGLCYNSFIVDYIPTDIYDKKVDFIVTEKGLLE